MLVREHDVFDNICRHREWPMNEVAKAAISKVYFRFIDQWTITVQKKIEKLKFSQKPRPISEHWSKISFFFVQLKGWFLMRKTINSRHFEWQLTWIQWDFAFEAMKPTNCAHYIKYNNNSNCWYSLNVWIWHSRHKLNMQFTHIC